MGGIDFTTFSTSITTALTGATGPIPAALAVGALILAVTVGWKVFKRFTH